MAEEKTLKKHKIVPSRPPSPIERYTIDEACAYLRCSPAKIFPQIADGTIRVIREGRRTYVPGSEIVRLSTLSA
jgi:excisionase family DNA binding protein